MEEGEKKVDSDEDLVSYTSATSMTIGREPTAKIASFVAEEISNDAFFNSSGKQYNWIDFDVDGNMEIFDDNSSDTWKFVYKGITEPNIVLGALNRAVLTDEVGERKFIDCGFYTALVYINIVSKMIKPKIFNNMMKTAEGIFDFTLDQTGVTGLAKIEPMFFPADGSKQEEVKKLALSARIGTIFAASPKNRIDSNPAYQEGENFIKVDKDKFAGLPITHQLTPGFLSLDDFIKEVEYRAGGKTRFYITLVQHMNYTEV